jgi:structural maintenance of chromosomes protein 5
MKRLEAGKQELLELERQLDVQKDLAREALNAVSARVENDDLPAIHERCQDKTVESLDEEIGVEQARLEVIQASNPRALEEYEKRVKEIDKIKQQRDHLTTDLMSKTEKINEIMRDWEPRLDALVGRINEAFSYNFEQISSAGDAGVPREEQLSCAGEVGIHKDDDFEQWAIEIKVRFRYVLPCTHTHTHHTALPMYD